MAKADDPPARTTPAQRAQQRRDQKLADVQEEIDSGRMTHRQLTPEEMEEHAGRREELQEMQMSQRVAAAPAPRDASGAASGPARRGSRSPPPQ